MVKPLNLGDNSRFYFRAVHIAGAAKYLEVCRALPFCGRRTDDGVQILAWLFRVLQCLAFLSQHVGSSGGEAKSREESNKRNFIGVEH